MYREYMEDIRIKERVWEESIREIKEKIEDLEKRVMERLEDIEKKVYMYEERSEGEDRLSNWEVGKIKKWVTDKDRERRRCNIVMKGTALPKEVERDIRGGRQWIQDFIKEKLEVECKVSKDRLPPAEQAMSVTSAEYSSEELFASYVERFEQFVPVNDVPDAKKVPLFLTMIGPKCYDVLRNSVAPDKSSTKTYDALKKVLLDYYTPEKCIIAERYRFHKRFQKTEETVTQFGVELKKLAQYCNFGTFLDDALRDQFVCGIVSEDTRRRLLVKPDLTYNSAVKEAVSMELVSNQTKEFAKQGNLYSLRRAMETETSVGVQGEECYMPRLWYQGTFGKQCRKKNQHRIHQLHEEPPTKEKVAEDCNCSLCISEVNIVEAINMVTPRLSKSLIVENKGIEFEVDTGAAVSEGATPVYRKSYTIPYGITDKVNKKIDELVENGLWTPVTSSDWASPLVVVPNKGSGVDSIRLCVDYKNTANKNVIRDRYPLPRLDNILNSLSEYLGHIIDDQGIRPTAKMTAILECPVPTNVTQLKSYLEMINFYATLSKAEQNYSQLDREALGLVFAVKYFYKYIYGRKFYLVTDNQPLNRILGSKTGIPPLAAYRLQRWTVILSNYDYELIVKRDDLKCADMLSRLPMSRSTGDEVLQIQAEEPLRSLDIARKTLKDPVLSKVVDLTKRGLSDRMGDKMLNHILTIVVPSKLRDQVLDLLHENHPGIVDAHVMQDTDSTKTSDKLLSTFSILGFPQELVSDNGPPFNRI
ncbi:uncharacterized protein [Temnothorax longispinosus]|uniref:uncharacterized protein n=1 Tax=Temnothorax longispinosus TaxID=300112 RepID=UPI003A9A29B5